MRLGQWLEELIFDVKFAFRQLRAAPVFAAIAVTTLALGIGGNSAIFALVDATLLRPLPYANPDRLVTIWETSDATSRSFASPPNMLDWNGRSRTFAKIAGFTPNVGGMVMAGRDGNAETVSRQWVTAGYRLDSGGRVRPTDRLGVVWRAAAGLRHFRGGDDPGGDDRRGVDGSSGLASHADRSCSGAAEHVA